MQDELSGPIFAVVPLGLTPVISGGIEITVKPTSQAVGHLMLAIA